MLTALAWVAGCGANGTSDGERRGRPDATMLDGGSSDAPVFDSANPDGSPDAGPPADTADGADAQPDGSPDLGRDASGDVDPGDANPGDATTEDATPEDASPGDTDPPDAPPVDTTPPPNCGDGVLDEGEECDDGNTTSEDGCSAACAIESCGDGVLQAGLGEECDDGNTASEDGCSVACIEESCGDRIVQAGLGEECDDGNRDDEDICSNDCLVRYECRHLPVACGPVSPVVTEHNLVEVDGCSFALEPEPADVVAARSEIIDALVERTGGALTTADILDDLNRDGRSGITTQSATRLRNHEWRGFRWDNGDDDVSYWYPQGVTGSSDARDDERIDDRRVMLVSWYNRTDSRPTRGARVSLADTTDVTRVDYRHMLLVTPSGDPLRPDFGPVETGSGDALHAGGMVWYGDLLYVADTTVGLRVFDMSRIMRVSHTDDHTSIGVGDSRVDAHGYRYIVPQLARYALRGDSCDLRFSFAGLDRSTDPPTIMTGEYESDDPGGRLVSWPLDTETDWLDVRAGEVRGVGAAVGAQTRMQGALTWEGNTYISSSSQYLHFGRLYRTHAGVESSVSAWVYGCEDLYYERDTGYIWTAAEHPGDRDVVGIPLRTPGIP